MRFFNLVATFVAALVLAACVSSGGSSSKSTSFFGSSSKQIADFRVGDRVDYEKGRWFHLELMALDDAPIGQAILENRSNPVMSAKMADRAGRGARESYKQDYPESRHMDLLDGVSSKFGLLRFAPQGCVVDVVVRDIDASSVGETPVLITGQRFVGTIRPERDGPRMVIFKDVRVREITTLRLPHEWGDRPTVTLVAKTCRVMNPGSDGKHVTASLRHRRDNVGMPLGLLIRPAGAQAAGRN